MGKFLDKVKNKLQGIPEDLGRLSEDNVNYSKGKIVKQKSEGIGGFSIPEDEFMDDLNGGLQDSYMNNYYGDEYAITPAQKPESFHHFILENQYKDLERSIRGLKDVWDKDKQTWVTKKKETHCFTDEEAEDILRTAQSHLATDIKLGYINADSFGAYMDTIYKALAFLFESIAEYRYGRYGDYETQYKMKLQNQKIFLELFTRIQANYSRAISGSENKATHGSVRGQESLQSNSNDFMRRNMGYT